MFLRSKSEWLVNKIYRNFNSKVFIDSNIPILPILSNQYIIDRGVYLTNLNWIIVFSALNMYPYSHDTLKLEES